MTVIASDNFNRANGGLGTNWTNRVGTFFVNTNSCRKNDTGGDGYAQWTGAGSFDSDQFARGTIVAIGPNTTIGVTVRASASGAYVLDVQSNGIFIGRIDSSGTYTPLDDDSRTIAVNDTIELQAEGTTIRGYHNSNLVFSLTDTTYSSGTPGVGGFYDGSTGTRSRIDNWEAGNLSAPIQDVDAPYYQNTNAYYDVVVRNTVSSVFVSNTNTIYSPTIALEIQQNRVENNPAVYGARVNTRVVAPYTTQDSAYYTATLHQQIAPDTFINVDSVYGSTVSQRVIAPNAINTSVVYAPTVNQQIRVVYVQNTPTYYNAVVANTVFAPFVDNTPSFYVYTVQLGVVAARTDTENVFYPLSLRSNLSSPYVENASVAYSSTVQQNLRATDVENEHTFYSAFTRLRVNAPIVNSTSAIYPPDLLRLISAQFIQNNSIVYTPNLVLRITAQRFNNVSVVNGVVFQLRVAPSFVDSESAFFDSTTTLRLLQNATINESVVYGANLGVVVRAAYVQNISPVYPPTVILGNNAVNAPYVVPTNTTYQSTTNLHLALDTIVSTGVIYAPTIRVTVSVPYSVNESFYYPVDVSTTLVIENPYVENISVFYAVVLIVPSKGSVYVNRADITVNAQETSTGTIETINAATIALLGN